MASVMSKCRISHCPIFDIQPGMALPSVACRHAVSSNHAVKSRLLGKLSIGADRPDTQNCQQTCRSFVRWRPRPRPHLESGYLFLLTTQLTQKNPGDLNDFTGKTHLRGDHESTPPLEMNCSFGCDKAKLRKVPGHLIKRLGLLLHPKIPRPEGQICRPNAWKIRTMTL